MTVHYLAEPAPDFDYFADTAITLTAVTAPVSLTIVHPATDPETVQLPTFDALLPGPATELDAVPEPVIERVHYWEISWWVGVFAFTSGMTTMAVLLTYL